MAKRIRFTKTVNITGFAATDENLGAQLFTTGANAGKYGKLTDDARVEGLMLLTEKADTGKTPAKGTLQYMDIVRFPVADSITLNDASLKQGIKGGASNGIKLVAYGSTYDPNLNGRVVDYSNETGDKWVDVQL